MSLSRVLLICFLFLAILFSGVFFYQQNYVTKAQANCTVTLPTNTGTVTTNINITQDNDYVLWARILTSNATVNSFYAQIDSGCPEKIGGTFDPSSLNKWTWINYKNGSTTNKATFTLTKGKHTLKIVGDSVGLGVDKILLLNNKCEPDPNDEGKECLKVAADPKPTTTQIPQTGSFTASASSPSDSKAIIMWTAVEGATKYNVYISEEENEGRFRRKESTSNKTITFDDLNSNEIAKFYVTAVVGSIETVQSNTVEVRVK